MKDKEFLDHLNESFTEFIIQDHENRILVALKTRYENYPTDKNNKEWLDFTDFVCKRRCKKKCKQSE